MHHEFHVGSSQWKVFLVYSKAVLQCDTGMMPPMADDISFCRIWVESRHSMQLIGYIKKKRSEMHKSPKFTKHFESHILCGCFVSLSSRWWGFGYMRHPCKGHGIGGWWLFLLKPMTGGDVIWNSQTLCHFKCHLCRDKSLNVGCRSKLLQYRRWQGAFQFKKHPSVLNKRQKELAQSLVRSVEKAPQEVILRLSKKKLKTMVKKCGGDWKNHGHYKQELEDQRNKGAHWLSYGTKFTDIVGVISDK